MHGITVNTAIYKNEMGNQTKISEYMECLLPLCLSFKGKEPAIVYTGMPIEHHRIF
jgi:hypothetical protein